MSLEVFEKLESKVQQAIDTITLLQMEIEELKEKNNTTVQEVQSAQHGREELERENSQLKSSSRAGRNVCRRCWVAWKKSNRFAPSPAREGHPTRVFIPTSYSQSFYSLIIESLSGTLNPSQHT